MKTILLALLFLSGFTFAQEQKAEARNKVVIIPIKDQIAPPELYILRRGLKTAIDQGADTVILDMNTPGGRVDTTFEMVKAIQKFPGKVYTYIDDEATSAGALISAGTDEIYLAPGATVGSSAPVGAGGGDIDQTMKLKIVSYLRAKARAISEGKGYRGEVISAMIDDGYELKIDGKVIKPKGELLNLTATEAMKEYGTPPQPLLGAGIEPSIESLMDNLLGEGNYTATRLEVTWSERLAQYLTMITPLLLAAGLFLIYVEFKTPGFGFFGIGGGLLISLFFLGHNAAGLSGHEPMLIFFIGFALVMIDVFFIPGFFVLAVPGAIMMLGSLLWGMSDIWPDQPIPWSSDFLLKPLTNLVLGIVGSIVLMSLLLKYMPSGGLWGKMVLASAIGGETTPSHTERAVPSLIGAQGHAITALFPSGQIEIGGKRYDARLELGTVQPGTAIRVTSVGEFELKVEAV
ncbi:MAG: NfeD family protein [Luteolibacter sp.]